MARGYAGGRFCDDVWVFLEKGEHAGGRPVTKDKTLMFQDHKSEN